MLIALPMVLRAAASVCSVPQLVLQSLMQLAAVCAAGRILHAHGWELLRLGGDNSQGRTLREM